MLMRNLPKAEKANYDDHTYSWEILVFCYGCIHGIIASYEICWRNQKMFYQEIDDMNKGRFCNTIASVALVHTSIQRD